MHPLTLPREAKFYDPTTAPYIENNNRLTAHIFDYATAKRVQLNKAGEFSQSARGWLPPENQHLTWYFMWAQDTGPQGRHDPLRGVVEDWFQRKAIATMRDRIHGYTRTLREQIVERGTGKVDLATDFAYRLPLQTICGLVGMPLDRETWLRDQIRNANDGSDFYGIGINHEVESYFWEMVAKRQREPKDELLDVIIGGWQAGTMSDREMLGFIWGFYAAGTDTTGTAIANLFSILGELNAFDHIRDNLDDDEILKLAFEETVRYMPPFPAVPVVTLAPVSFGDLAVPTGSTVVVHLTAANRDLAVNRANEAAQPLDIVDLARTPNLHMGFGVGAHHCLGERLARLEAMLALRELLTYLPDLTFDTSQPFHRNTAIVDTVTTAHFEFDQAAAEKLLS